MLRLRSVGDSWLVGAFQISRSPAVVSGVISGGDLVLANDDGSFVEPIEIPAGTVVFVSNGDGTWSVG